MSICFSESLSLQDSLRAVHQDDLRTALPRAQCQAGLAQIGLQSEACVSKDGQLIRRFSFNILRCREILPCLLSCSNKSGENVSII